LIDPRPQREDLLDARKAVEQLATGDIEARIVLKVTTSRAGPQWFA
jgi:hypothetical protein